MLSVYVFVSVLCFKSSFGYPQAVPIPENVQPQVAPTQNLGTESEAESIRNDMTRGIGGTAIATFDGKTPRTFIFNNSSRSICNGNLKGMVCEGTVVPFTITAKEDYCYATSYASIGNDLCLSSRSVKLVFKNTKFECTSGDGTPTLTVTRQEYQDLCNEVTSRQVVYKYYTNASDPAAIPIPNPNQFVKCINNEPGVCEFKEDKTIPGTVSTKVKDNTVTSTSSPTEKKSEDNGNGSNALFQRFEIILFAVIVRFLFQN